MYCESPCKLQSEYTANTIGAKYSCGFGVVASSILKSDEVALILEGNYDTTM